MHSNEDKVIRNDIMLVPLGRPTADETSSPHMTDVGLEGGS